MVVALCGLPGSGKSTLAVALAKATGWIRVDRDMLRGQVFPRGGYSDADKIMLAKILRARMKEVITAGDSVILDGMTFSRRHERETFARAARAADAHWLLVWIDCDAASARERVAGDTGHPAADRSIALVDHVAARFEIPEEALRIDAALPTSAQLDRVLAAINGPIERGER